MNKKLKAAYVYKNRRYEEIKSDPEIYERYKEGQRLRYIKRKGKGQVTSIEEKSYQEKRQQRKRWRKASKKYRQKKKRQGQSIITVIKDTIKNEMEDVKVQTDNRLIEKIVKTNTTEISKISNNNVRKPKCRELDKFKRRLIRAIARLLYTENKAEADVWDDLKNETGCDCELLWSRMRALTIKKLFRLFTAEDKIENITKIAQLSVTDWLLYDLVLVHEKVDVIGQELVIKEEPTFLRDLFDVVVEFNIENETSDSLSKKWFDATAKYNNTGKRQCSPMLLQKRWYQLKERSRSNFYNFWFQYRGDSKKLEKANEFKPSDLQLDIVKRYKEIVTMPFLSWEDLIKEGKVVLPEDFERLRLARNKITISENEPDLQLIEPQLETIDLDENIDSDDSVNKDTDNKKEFNDFNIDIVKIESLAEENDDVSVLESVRIPLEKSESIEINNSDIDDETTKDPDDYDLEVIDSDSEQIMPRIASVTSTAYLVSANNDESIPKDIIDIENSETRMNSTKAVNIILEEIVKNVVNNKVNTNFDKRLDKINKKKILNLDKDIDGEEVEKPVTTQNSKETYDINNDIGFDEFSSNFNFIDNGIEFVDDGIAYMDEDCTHEYNMQSEIKSEINEATNEEESKIDLKLLLSPVCYTKKLDDMDVFRFIDYNSIKDGRVLENAFLESKPKDKKSINMKEMFQECNADNTDHTSNIKSDFDDVLPDNDVTISSWLFRKPKVINYNPIQLCKNPDFNTRLKRLGAAFYTSQRNRLQLKECKPLTVDLHKTFESKLINNTLNLKKNKHDSDVEINVHETIATSCKSELPETIEPRNDNEIAANNQIHTIKTSEVHTERKKVINLPDINQIRRVNQGLQVAEVSPIQISNPVTIETNIKPQNNLLNTVIESVNQYIDSEDTTDKAITETPASQYSIQANKVIGVSDNENTKAVNLEEENINVDNEESKIVSLKNSEIDTAKSYKCYSRNALTKQSLPKLKTKTFTKKYMELSWLPKPQATRTDVSDCLLAADTVERILSLCKNDYVSVNPKVYKPKRKKKNGVTDKNKTENQAPTSPQNISIQENKIQKEIEKPKKTKLRISITSQTTNVKNICCWARHKIQNLYKRTKAKHFCAYDRCVCCCKDELEEKIVAIEEQRKRCEFIVLSDDESTVTAKQQYPVSKVTIGTNTDYDKDFEDQFAANLSLFKDNANKGYIPILSLPFGAVKQTFCNENGCQTQSPNRIEKPLLPSVTDKIIDDTNTQKNKPKFPISLGKNKILLCSFKPTTKAVSTQKVNKRYQNNLSERILPEGCHLVLLPNRELALSIDPGIELDANQLSKLPPLIASVQKQINIIPTLENVIEPSNAILNEETIIHLSDDENSDMNGNNNISPTETHMENSIASIVIDLKPIGTITNVDKRISDSELNSPIDPCQNINPVTKNSTATDITEKDVIIESSTNEIISEDKITDEVINNSINNNDDASGVNKKTILSDLMEMSGISTDDINIGNNDIYVNSNDIGVVHNSSDVTTAGSISIIPQVLTQSDSFTSDLQRQYANITKILGIKPINNLIVKAALIRCPEINVVSTFPELKFAYENGAHFLKMDIEDGIIVPINVCIKKNMEQIRMKDAKDLSKAPKSIIDLTEDNEIDSSNIRPIQQTNKQEINNSCEVTIPKIQGNKKGSIKPIKMFKAIQPSILRYSGRSLLGRPMTDPTMRQNKIKGLTKHKRKQRLCAKNVDLEVDNIVKTQNNPSDNILSDGESDEEPLAKKAKRLKDNLEREVKNNIDYQPLDVNNEINSEKSAQIDVNYDLPIRLEPYVFNENHGQSSDEDCILGV